ncbi:MAG: erythromycin esterase family protein [Saprospiraceae bacterium]
MKKVITWLYLAIFLVACQKEEFSAEVLDYLAQNHAAITANSPNSLEPLFADTDLNRYDVFLTGENHAIAANTEIYYLLLQYYKQKVNFRYLLVELQYAAGATLQRYLDTGDEEMLAELMHSFGGSFYATRENFEFWKKVRAYNLTLEPERRIQVIGIDVEHNGQRALRYLQSLLPATSPPGEIAISMQKLQAFSNVNYAKNSASMQMLESLQDQLEMQGSVFENYLGEHFFAFEFTLQNTLNAAYFYQNGGKLEDREQFIQQNFIKIYKHYTPGKYFGQWGGFHVVQKGTHPSLANFLQYDIQSPVIGKVLSVFIAYQNSQYRKQRNEGVGTVESLEKDNPYTQFAQSPYTLFGLTGTNSPFTRNIHWWITTEKPNGGVTTDYFQYLLLVKDSPAESTF